MTDNRLKKAVLEDQEEKTPEWFDEKIEELNAQIASIVDKAETVVADFWSFKIAENARRRDSKKKNHSVMGLRIRTRSEGRYVTIEWYYNDFVKTDKGWTPLSRHIKKPRNQATYTESQLLKKACAWEIDIVLETEKQLSYFRKKISQLTQLRGTMEREKRKALKIEEANMDD